MASLRLPRMCCPFRDDGTDLVLTSPVYHVTCGCSAVLGLLGLALGYRPTKGPIQSRPNGGRIRLASSMITTGLLVNSVLWLSLPDFLSNQTAWFPHVLCIVLSTWIHYFSCVLFWAFFCYSLEIAQLLSPNPTERFGRFLTFLCWGASSLVLLHGLLLLLSPNPTERCDSTQGLVLFHDVVLYIPLLLALLGSPFLLRRAIVRVPAVLKMHCGVYTSSERFRKQTLCRRLLGISGVFVACWIGNVLCDVVLLLVEVWGTPQAPRQMLAAARTLFVITGILNPAFCCVHSLAFYGWRSSSAPSVNQCGGTAAPHVTGEEEEGDEEHHLLMCGPPASGKLSIPNILQLMDSYSSMEFRCSALEINAVRLLGARDAMAAPSAGSELKPRHSNV
ncbi:PREDICTED: G-protein coupled receptor 143-like [Nanorana parkeri]|uniref:G-protein coupled receptor 143-like n=1 Tax=Nanorana parkeri TaxID=125878 RepID=UPI0008546EE4|nr:PREDICTED: G-protein coupled receptor 143-like [Nanorana parkeri]